MSGDTFGRSLSLGMGAGARETFAAIAAIEAEIRELDPERGDELIAQARDLVRLGLRSTYEALEMALDRARMGT
jgi:hypothetical protein